MDSAVGVKTAIIGFIFVCLVMPQLIRNRSQFYLALSAVLVGIFFQILAVIFGQYPPSAFGRVCLVANHVLDIVAILLLVMAAGGLTARQLAGDMARAYEVMRRGEQEKELIIPLPGQKGHASEAERRVYTIDEAGGSAGGEAGAQQGQERGAERGRRKEDDGPIPLE